MGKVRLCDIASDAGVSVSAVSRILSCDNSRKHSDETKKRVIAVAEKLGWFDSVSDKAIKAKKPLRVRRLYSSSVNAYQKALFDKGFNKAFDVVSSHIPVELVDDNEELAVVFGDEFDNVSDVPVTAKIVVNEAGALLPSTGGMGTTVIYIIGAVLVIGAGIVLVVRRRTNA